MRDRLIDLLWCIGREYDEYCDDSHEVGLSPMEGFEEMAADHLLANGVIVPPCKVGDTVYICTCFGFWYTKPEINKCEMQIKSIRVTESRMIFEAEHGKDNVDYFELKDIGKTVFLTREEAEKALAEREGKG